MHEYSIALEISKIAEKQAENKPISEISLSIGALSGIFDQSIVFYLKEIFKTKNNSFIQINTEHIEPEFLCSCGKKYTAANMLMPCPFCSSFKREILAGNECIIKSIKIEDDEK